MAAGLMAGLFPKNHPHRFLTATCALSHRTPHFPGVHVSQLMLAAFAGCMLLSILPDVKLRRTSTGCVPCGRRKATSFAAHRGEAAGEKPTLPAGGDSPPIICVSPSSLCVISLQAIIVSFIFKGGEKTPSAPSPCPATDPTQATATTSGSIFAPMASSVLRLMAHPV